MLEIRLRMFQLWFNKRKKIIIGCLLAIIGLLLILWAAGKLFPQYYYIDLNGNKGISAKCWEGQCGLYCSRDNGGKIAVQQFWKGE